MMTWFRALSATGKSLAVICAVILATLGFAATLGDHVGLPAQVQTNTVDIAENTGEISGVQQKMDQMICLQLLDGADPQSCL